MLNWTVSPSCRLLNAMTRFVSFGPGLTLLVVLTVTMAVLATKQNKTRVEIRRGNGSFFITYS